MPIAGFLVAALTFHAAAAGGSIKDLDKKNGFRDVALTQPCDEIEGLKGNTVAVKKAIKQGLGADNKDKPYLGMLYYFRPSDSLIIGSAHLLTVGYTCYAEHLISVNLIAHGSANADPLRAALEEDAGDAGDVTTLATIPMQAKANATMIAKSNGTVAGVQVAQWVFDEVDDQLDVKWNVNDGDQVETGKIIASISGSARAILVAERVVLNYMQRMSGIATAARAMANAAKPARVLETRKTVPGLRVFDKWAVLLGGAENHRMGLYDMVLIKDNHIAAAGGIRQALDNTEVYLANQSLDIPVELETRTLEEVREVVNLWGQHKHLKRIMLDNMVKRVDGGGVDTTMLEEALAILKPLMDDGLETEASGNVDLDTAPAIGATGVTFVSVGALTHSVRALDISLNIENV